MIGTEIHEEFTEEKHCCKTTVSLISEHYAENYDQPNKTLSTGISGEIKGKIQYR